MSRIYFHSWSGEVELRGSERAYMGCTVDDLMCWSLDLHRPSFFRDDYYNKLATMFNDKCLPWGNRDDALIQAIKLHVGSSFREAHRWVIDGIEHEMFATALNTAYTMGSDPIRLMTRLHAQCEIHCYIEGPNRSWVAGIIDEGRYTGIMRPNQGWETVSEFLRIKDDEPVICSYSVTDQFPNQECAKWGGWNGPTKTNREKWDLAHPDEPIDDSEDTTYWDEPDEEGFYDLSMEERWNISLAGLRKMGNDEDGMGLEISPDNWTSYYWGRNMNGFKIKEKVHELLEAEKNVPA